MTIYIFIQFIHIYIDIHILHIDLLCNPHPILLSRYMFVQQKQSPQHTHTCLDRHRLRHTHTHTHTHTQHTHTDKSPLVRTSVSQILVFFVVTPACFEYPTASSRIELILACAELLHHNCITQMYKEAFEFESIFPYLKEPPFEKQRKNPFSEP